MVWDDNKTVQFVVVKNEHFEHVISILKNNFSYNFPLPTSQPPLLILAIILYQHTTPNSVPNITGLLQSRAEKQTP